MVSGFHLWIVLAGLFVLENLRVLSPSSVIFRRRWIPADNDGDWVAASAPEYPASGRWSWALGPLLPWRGPLLVAQDAVVALSPQAIAPNVALNVKCSRAFRYGDIESVAADDGVVRINRAYFVRCDTQSNALRVATLIERLQTLPEGLRESEIRAAVRCSFERQSNLAEGLETFRRKTRAIGLLVDALWMTCFIVLPIALILVHNDVVLIPVAAIIWTLSLGVAVAAPLARRRLESGVRSGFPWSSVKYLIYPVSAMRAREELGRDLCVGWHPAAVCVELLRGKDRADRCRELFLHEEHPASFSGADQLEVQAVSIWFNRLAASEMKRYLVKAAPEALTELTPARPDDRAVAFCPRCRMTYQSALDNCPDCPGVSLETFRRPGRGGKTG